MATQRTKEILDDNLLRPNDRVNGEDFSIFRIFKRKEDVKDLADLLSEQEIAFSLIDNAYSVDITLTGNTTGEIQFLVRKKDFETVNQLLEEQATEQVKQLNGDYYLYEFTTNELMEVICKKDEWSAIDYVLAQQILRQRGITPDLAKANATRISELSEPEKASGLQLFAGYFFAVFFALIGLLIGWYLWKSGKTLPNGDKRPAYTDQHRKHGKTIFIISVVIFILVITDRLLREVYTAMSPL